jgi:hypothetical protein
MGLKLLLQFLCMSVWHLIICFVFSWLSLVSCTFLGNYQFLGKYQYFNFWVDIGMCFYGLKKSIVSIFIPSYYSWYCLLVTSFFFSLCCLIKSTSSLSFFSKNNSFQSLLCTAGTILSSRVNKVDIIDALTESLF